MARNKRFAVAIAEEGDGVCIEIHEGRDWREATMKHSQSLWQHLEDPRGDEEIEDDAEFDGSILPDNIGDATEDAYQQSELFAVIEIPERA